MPKQIKDYGKIRLVLMIVLALNWSVAIAKIIFGLGSRSTSMTADGFHSLSDGASNIIGLIGIHFASKAKDIDHPYGHKKYETFFSLGIAFLLFLVAIGIIHESLGRFNNAIALNITPASFIVMVITIMVNFIVMRYESKKGIELKSDILLSDSMHTRADIFTSVSVIMALIAIEMGFPLLDPVTSIIISVFIAYSGYKIVRQSSMILCDSAAIVDLKQIVDIVLSVEGVKTCHKIRTRGRPDDIYIDLHVQVDSEMHVGSAHKISYAIEDAIKKSLPQVVDIVVHIEPKE
ncbi:MAG: Ferrous-iron efflux pump FieF [Candidatus Omnitrophica bacterium ADurb.Bin205]|nr:MAG: Ferrous-iron efflux pump FieF [Candidatus Omnitrophica bacterium ADurb.Bin205]